MENLKKWKPSENQKAVLRAMQAINYHGGIVAAIQGCGLAPASYYEWFDNPNFVAWWRAEADAFFVKNLTSVKGAVLSAATDTFDKGDAKYNAKAQELFLQRFDKDFSPRSQKRVEHSGGVDVGIDLTNFTDLQLRALARASGIDNSRDATPDAPEQNPTPEPTGQPETFPGASGDVGDVSQEPA